MSTHYLLSIGLHELDGACVLNEADYLPIWAEKKRPGIITDPEKLRFWFCSKIVWVIDLNHVGYYLINLLKTKTSAPAATINEKGQIIKITAPGNIEIRNANMIVPHEENMFKIRDIFHEFDIGHRKKDPLTISALARGILRQKMGYKSMYLDGSALDNVVYGACRAAYRGGYHMARAGEYGAGRVYDFNSLYPWVMSNIRIPVGAPLSYPLECARNPYYFYGMDIEARPKKDKLDWIPGVFGFYIFKNGTYILKNTWITDIDYFLLYECYDIKVTKQSTIQFETMPGEELFGDFVEEWYNKKRFSEGAEKASAKLVLNSSSGSMGRSDKVFSKEPYLVGDKIMYKYTYRQEENKKNLGYMPAAAAITAHGRFVIINLINQIGPENVIYSNTDSVIVKDNVRLETSPEIGTLKNEFEFTKARVLGHNSYFLTDGQNVKAIVPGMTRLDMEMLTPADYNKFKPGAEVLTHRWKMFDGGKVQVSEIVTIGGKGK